MPSLYKEQTKTLTSWQRTKSIIIYVPVEGSPSIVVNEEMVQSDGTKITSRDLPVTITATYDPDYEFDLRDPSTDELIGRTATERDVFMLIYGYVRDKQIERDKAQGN